MTLVRKFGPQLILKGVLIMLFTKKVQATVENVYTEVIENVPNRVGSTMDLVYFNDSSKSFYTEDKVYKVTFQIGEKKKTFTVDRATHDSLKVGDSGELKYSADKFVEFNK